jgi:MFS family permease
VTSLSPRPANPVRSAHWALFVLTLINLVNYLDRFVVSSLVESLRRSELHLDDARIGFLASGFVVVYMLASPIFGTLGDRAARPRLIGIGIALWSVATALGGVAHSFGFLFVARSTVGIGEAAYVTIASALLADFYPREQRGRVFAIFNSAIPIGSACGYVLGGLVDQHYGWRAAFFVAGAPGILLAILAARLPDPPRGGFDPHGENEPLAASGHAGFATAARDYRQLLRNRPYRLIALGYAAYTFALGGLAYWTPAFLERVRGVPPAEATVQFGAIVVVTGFVGTAFGGWLGDRLLRRTPQAYLWMSGVTTLIAAPFAVLAFSLPGKTAYLAAMATAEVLVFMSTGPINSAIVNAVQPLQRATAVGLSTLIVHLFGDVPSPPLIGMVSEMSSLGRAFLLVPVAFAIGGLVWLWAARVGAGTVEPAAILAAHGQQS